MVTPTITTDMVHLAFLEGVWRRAKRQNAPTGVDLLTRPVAGRNVEGVALYKVPSGGRVEVRQLIPFYASPESVRETALGSGPCVRPAPFDADVLACIEYEVAWAVHARLHAPHEARIATALHRRWPGLQVDARISVGTETLYRVVLAGGLPDMVDVEALAESDGREDGRRAAQKGSAT